MHNDKTYKPELLALISPVSFERKYGGERDDITENFFPPNMNIAGMQMLTIAELKAECPQAMHYMAPWGEKKALAEERLREQEAVTTSI